MSTTVTKRKQAEAQQAELLARLKSLIDNTNDFVATADPAGNVLYVNPMGLQLVGLPPDIGPTTSKFSDFHPPEWVSKIEQEYLPLVLEKGLWAGELALQHVNGATIPVSGAITLVKDEAGQPIGFGAIYHDISERKQVEEALRDSEARYSAVINQARDGVILVQDHLCLFVNQALAEMLGYTPAEMENTPFIPYVAPESQQVIAGRIKARLEGQELPALYEARLLRKDGTVIDAELSPNVIQYRGKTAYMDFIRDTSERKRLEIERERLQQEVIEAQQRAIQELSTPIIPVMDRIIVMPLIGSIDTMRARDITRTLLAGIRENRAKVVILDITGVPLVDSGVANHLNKTIQAARLKGARTIVTGVSNAVAETIVDLGIDWSGIETLANLQTGLVAALTSLGIKLSKG